MTAEVLFNLFKNGVLAIWFHRFRFDHYFLKRDKGGLFCAISPP
ncbi:hypothetical protein OUQ_0143 [Helicobacter pylori R055a]|nr:hypothetical protein OUQ_0143 [Helicobacter pylori R055a]